VALDRQSIQRRDFSVSRRGYDPAEVDAHLSAVADEVVAFQAEPRGAGTLASSASDHVRSIVEAAESSAAQIRREAQTEADATRQRAEQHAQQLSASSAAMLERLEATKRELEVVIESLRAGTDSFNADAGTLEASRAAVTESDASAGNGAGVAATPAFGESEPASEPAPATAPEPPSEREPVSEPESASEREPASEPVAAPPASEAASAATAGADAPPSAGTSDDAEAARLVALNMALNRTPRDQAAKYLSENYRLADPDGLLDEVYSSIEG
jgi:DivIVA domain-containing protein